MGFRYNHQNVLFVNQPNINKKSSYKVRKIIRQRDTAARRHHRLSKRDLLFLKSLGLKIRKNDGNK
jgi:hypothetical protein